MKAASNIIDKTFTHCLQIYPISRPTPVVFRWLFRNLSYWSNSSLLCTWLQSSLLATTLHHFVVVVVSPFSLFINSTSVLLYPPVQVVKTLFWTPPFGVFSSLSHFGRKALTTELLSSVVHDHSSGCCSTAPISLPPLKAPIDDRSSKPLTWSFVSNFNWIWGSLPTLVDWLYLFDLNLTLDITRTATSTSWFLSPHAVMLFFVCCEFQFALILEQIR